MDSPEILLRLIRRNSQERLLPVTELAQVNKTPAPFKGRVNIWIVVYGHDLVVFYEFVMDSREARSATNMCQYSRHVSILAKFSPVFKPPNQ